MSSQEIGPCLYKSVDLESLERMCEQYEEEIARSRERGQKFWNHRSDYKQLQTKLETISDKVSHQVMVPMTKKAFMPGQLVHTNEILVLLGDNWFAQRSAKQAREICERRIKQCDETLNNIEKEVNLYDSWLREAKKMAGDSNNGEEGNIEIREPLNEEELFAWRREHQQRVREHRQSLKEQNRETKKDDEDEELWKRLDELEVEEELEEHLQRTQKDDDNDEEDIENNSEEEDIEGEEEGFKPGQVHTMQPNDNGGGYALEDEDGDDLEEDEQESSSSDESDKEAIPKRRVSFGSTMEHEIISQHEESALSIEDQVILFEHSKAHTHHKSDDDTLIPQTPGDIFRIFGQSCNQQPKSILKASTKYSKLPQDESEDDEIEFQSHEESEPVQPAVSSVVVERQVETSSVIESSQPVVKQSLFKRSRARH